MTEWDSALTAALEQSLRTDDLSSPLTRLARFVMALSPTAAAALAYELRQLGHAAAGRPEAGGAAGWLVRDLIDALALLVGAVARAQLDVHGREVLALLGDVLPLPPGHDPRG